MTYEVEQRRARKRWVRPRLSQLVQQARCLWWDHQWTPWRIDDYDGPGEQVGEGPDEWMPLLSRESQPGEWGIRSCTRDCGAVQIRHPESRMCGATSPLATACGLPAGHHGAHVADLPGTPSGGVAWGPTQAPRTGATARR